MGERYTSTVHEALIDDELWPPLYAAIRRARGRIDLSQLLFEPEFAPIHGPLVDELIAAARRGARVRVLVNENAAVPDSIDELRDHFQGTDVEVRSMEMSPNVLHAKIVLADDDAFLIDPPFEQKYADSSAHTFDLAHRLHEAPFHSVSLRLAGRALVTRLSQLFDSLWDRAPLPAAPAGSTTGPFLAWTAPAGIWGASASEGILDAYLRAIRAARRFIYLETQYLTSPRIVAALADALSENAKLEVILLLNEHMDVPTYDKWQDIRLGELGVPDHPRVGVFTVWSPSREPGEDLARAVYLHSKVAIIDDMWATLGSANLDSISLHDADEFVVSAPRNVELNAVFEDPAFATRLRRRLWGEHLGDAGVWRAEVPQGGWLAHWRALAAEDEARFDAGEPRMVGRILPYRLGTSGASATTRSRAPQVSRAR